MKSNKYISGIVIAAATLTMGSCSNDAELPGATETSLILDVVGASRAAIYDTSLPDPSVFTMECVNLTGEEHKYEIRDVEYAGGATSITGSPVMLRNDSTYQVYAIYPCIENQKELISGQLNIDVFDQIDYMSAASGKLAYNNSHATLKFGHMLSLLRLNFRKSDFITEDYLLESLLIDGIGVEGTYDLFEQDFVRVQEECYDASVGKSLASDSYVTLDIMVVPTTSGTVYLSTIVNRKNMRLKFEHNGFLAGKIHTLNITVSADQLIISEGEIQPWNASSTTESPTANPAPGKAVDLGLSKLWADRNVGAYSTSEYGNYFYYAQSVSDMWGEDWETPTSEDLSELINNCTWNWTNIDGINGYQVFGNGNSIFLPAAGWTNEQNSSFYDINQKGLYSSCDEGGALEFSAASKNVSSTVNTSFYGSIRPVKVKN